MRKEKDAVERGYEFLRIKEIEWKKENREKSKNKLMNLLMPNDVQPASSVIFTDV
jgi:hypothetical protein